MAKINLRETKKFLSHDLWHLKPEEFGRWQRVLIRTVRIIVLGVRGYTQKKLVLSASALTLFSLLSIVPVIAMIFGIAQGFGLEEFLTQQLQVAFASQPEVLANLLNYSHNLLSNTHGGVIAGLGLLLLLWSVIMVLSNIEDAFNYIWYVKRGRSWTRKFTDYLSIMLVAPIMIILTGTMNILLSTYIHTFAEKIQHLSGALQRLIIFSVNFIPYLTTCFLFFMIYIVMPNIRVKPRAALSAGIIAGIAFQLFQWAYIAFQVGISRYNAIYGSFASIPLFITWLQYSWIIVLVGAEISYCVQNLAKAESDIQTVDISHKMRMLYSLYILHYIAKKFKGAHRSPDLAEISQKLELPVNLCTLLLDDMLRCDLVAKTQEEYKADWCYVPALDISHLRMGFIINKLESLGKMKSFGNSDVLHDIKVKYNDLEHAMNASESNKNILDF